MTLTLAELREHLTALDVRWEAPDEEPSITATAWECEHYRDSLGSRTLFVFLILDDEGQLLSLQTQPLFDLSIVRFAGPLATRMLELTSERLAARFVREDGGPQVALRIDLPIFDGQLGTGQLQFVLEQILATVDETHTELRTVAERGQSGGFQSDPAGDAP